MGWMMGKNVFVIGVTVEILESNAVRMDWIMDKNVIVIRVTGDIGE